MQQKIKLADTTRLCTSNNQKLKPRFQNSEAIKADFENCSGFREEIVEKSGVE